MTLHEVQVTGADQGESLSRYDFASGDVVWVDRGYIHPATSDLVSTPVWLHSKGRSCSGMVHAQSLPSRRRYRLQLNPWQARCCRL
ncbi:MAG: hypothetical protein PHD43_03525 [Methylococcales bacterium]|nr:hypothetical protein [Methylococcales bacterium]